jgi:hypothetical protein
MKKLLYLIPLIVIAFIATVSAQSTTDTVYIPGAQSLEISNIINADTAVTEHRVYVLDRGAIYYIESRLRLNSDCEFIATGNPDARPPVLAPAILAGGGSEETFMELTQTDVNIELNDLYFLSLRSDGQTLGWSRAISLGANNISLKLRRVVMDGFSEAGIRVFANFFKLDVQDCHFRNFNTNASSYFGGQPFHTDGLNHPDTVKFINNTFFACNSYLFAIRGLGPYSQFEHNTLVHGTANPFLIRQADNIYIKNNLFYDSHAWGGDPEQTINGWFLNYPDTVSTSIYRIRKRITYGGYEVPGPEAYNDTALGLIFDFNDWTNVAENNAYYFTDKLKQFYQDWNDTVTVMDSVDVPSGARLHLLRTLNMPRWINDLSLTVLDSLSDSNNPDYAPNVRVENNIEADPGFDASVTGHTDSLVGYIQRIASRSLDRSYPYELNFPPTWPLPENLAYTNTALQSASTHGYALGDLNWFPDQKEQWATGVEEISSEIPDGFSLSEAYPNPFNPETKINFSIPQNGNIKIAVYNLLGQKIKTLVNQEFNAGSYSATWNGKDDFGKQVASGIYLFRLETESFKTTKKVMLMK